MLDGQAVLQPLDPERRLSEVDVGDPHGDGFAHAQPVPVHHQEKQVVADAVPRLLRRFQEPFDFRLVEEILVPLVEVSGRSAGTLYISPVGHLGQASSDALKPRCSGKAARSLLTKAALCKKLWHRTLSNPAQR